MQLEGYSELAKLTRGGMATVYRARQDSLDRTVAIKFLSAEFLWDESSREFFDQESLVIARLNHPNIIKVIDRGVTVKNRPYFVMEYVKGRDLDGICKKFKLSFQAKVQLIMQVCRGMAFAHKNGVVHRDIKPSNILIDSHGHVYILDFGIAWIEATGKPVGEDIVGTPDYMSPEQFSDPRSISSLSDIYSLGAVMYRLFTGSVATDFMDDLRVGLTDLPNDLQDLIVQCLQIDPSLRPVSADEVGFRLLKLLNGAHIKQQDRDEAEAAIGKAADKFELLDVVKRNSFGAVYLFEDKLRHNLIVVKKRVNSHAGLKHANELKTLNHNNLIRVVGTSHNSNTFIVVMEYLTGGSLQDRLSRPFGLRRFLKIALQISQAMKTAHDHEILHGNLRPSNILFSDKGDVKVTDFGFSKHYSDNLKRDWYQPLSRHDPSVQRDMYSVGAIFYHMLTGSPATIRYGQLNADKSYDALDDSLQELVRSMIEMQSLNRLQSFSEVVEKLNSIKLNVVQKEKVEHESRFKWQHLVLGLVVVNLLILSGLYMLVPDFAQTVNDWLGIGQG